MATQTHKKTLESAELFGHPVGLFVLFFTEMWERFSFYGMRALLILYMTQYLLVDPVKASEVFGYNALAAWITSTFGPQTVQQMGSQIYGLYTGFVYFTPFFGGLLADRFWGQHKTVYLGGILMAVGHFLMASEQAFLLALFFLILGNGAFKPNISTQVGNLYADGDPRRDKAFTIFYMGINLGALLSPLVCGTLGQTLGWHWGFGAAGVGMLLGLIVYWLGSKHLPMDAISHDKGIQAPPPKLTKQEWGAVGALAVLCFLNIIFWAIYEQQGNTLQIWADKKINWTISGLTIPSSWFQSFNPAMIIIFAPLQNMFWAWQAKQGKEPSSVTKMGIGCILCGSAYLLMILASLAMPGDERGSVLWLLSTVFVFTIGELYLSPIGLSLVTKVAPKPILSMMMGMWFLSSFFGNTAAGLIGTLYDVMAKENFFAILTLMGVLTGAVFMIIRRPIGRVIGRSL